MNNIIFNASLPRSGSTLLQNILGQNSKFHVTPTSGLVELLISVQNNWKNYIEFKAEGLEIVKPRIEKVMKNIIYGFFEDEFKNGKIVFDKSRGWLQYIELLENILERKIQVIVCVRDIRAIVASFEKIYRNRGIEYHEAVGDSYFRIQTVYGRAQELLNEKNVLGLSINRFRDVIQRGMKDRLIIVPYRYFTRKPQEVLDKVHELIGIEKFIYNTDNVEQITRENDYIYGMDLHRIRSKIEPIDNEPWKGILPDDLSQQLAETYRDINSLA